MDQLLQLIQAQLEGELTAAQLEQLQDLLRDDPAALETFVQTHLVDQQLRDELVGQQLGQRIETAVKAAKQAEVTAEVQPVSRNFTQRVVKFFATPTTLAMSAAVLVLGLLLTAMAFMTPPFYHTLTRIADVSSPVVAEVIFTKNAKWSRKSLVRGRPRVRLSSGQTLELLQGEALLRFTSGAVVLVEGPAEFTAQDRNRLQLRHGQLAARVPPRAIGFTVEAPTVDVVDLGTEFSVYAAEKETEVQVLTGRVVVYSRNDANRSTRKLAAGEAVVFGNSSSQGFYVQDQEMKRSIFLGMAVALAGAGANSAPSMASPFYVQDPTHVDANGNAYISWQAEDYSSATMRTPNATMWQIFNDASAANSKALLGDDDNLAVNDGVAASGGANSNIVTYDFKFVTPGTYTLYWTGRAGGPADGISGGAGANDSWHAPAGGFGDDQPNARVNGFGSQDLVRFGGNDASNNYTSDYQWFRQGGTDTLRIDFIVTADNVANGDLLSLSVGAREDGLLIDRWLLSTNSNLFGSTAGNSVEKLNNFATVQFFADPELVPEPVSIILWSFTGLAVCVGGCLLQRRCRRQ